MRSDNQWGGADIAINGCNVISFPEHFVVRITMADGECNLLEKGKEPTKIALKMPQRFVETQLKSFAISISPSVIHLLKMCLDSRPLEPEVFIVSSIKTSEIGHLRFVIPDTTQVIFHPTVGSEAIVNRGIWSTVAAAAKISTQIYAPDQTENKRPMGPSYYGEVNDRASVFLQTEASRSIRVFGVAANYARAIELIEWEKLTRGLHLDQAIGGHTSFAKARAAGIRASHNLNVWAAGKELVSLIEFINRLRSLG